MSRLRIPGLVDILRVTTPQDIRAVADDRRMDRRYEPRGPLLNRIVLGRVRRFLVMGGEPLPPVAPRGAVRPTPNQAELEASLNASAANWPTDDSSVRAIAAYVRGGSGAPGQLAQQAVGRLFDPQYRADEASWKAACVLEGSLSSFNPIARLWWALTRAPERARRLLAAKVGQDPSGLHGTGVAVHNMSDGLLQMRKLWADPKRRDSLSASAAASWCLLAPKQVLRQPTAAGLCPAGAFEETTLVMLQLRAANQAAPSAETALMTESWSRCPAHRWTRELLASGWRAAQEGAHG